MRLGGSRRSGNVIDARGSGRGVGIGLGGLVILLLGWFFGVDTSGFAGLVDGGSSSAGQAVEADGSDAGNDFLMAVLGDTEDVWNQLFAQSGSDYPEPELVRFEGIVQSACGTAQSATGPFYCPADQRIYMDLNFLRELERMGASGDFAAAYVIAHEVGHHVQNVQGILGAVQERQSRMPDAQANALSVRVELMADCYAGVWAHHADAQRDVLEPGEEIEGIEAAAAVGDDNLMEMAGRAAAPESFTHGSSAQRVGAFRAGFDSGDPGACDSFNASRG
jgi:predicted metalloprotease